MGGLDSGTPGLRDSGSSGSGFSRWASLLCCVTLFCSRAGQACYIVAWRGVAWAWRGVAWAWRGVAWRGVAKCNRPALNHNKLLGEIHSRQASDPVKNLQSS